MFTKKERSSFKYWFAHWCAFQMTALNLKVWKFKYIFHDIEKPWLMWLWKDYKRVQKWHRTHNSHHLEYSGEKDWDAMVIDWECSRFTKEASQLNAYDEMCRKLNVWVKGEDEQKYYKDAPVMINLEDNMVPALKKFGLLPDDYVRISPSATEMLDELYSKII